MTTSEATPAGGRKYFLIAPETFELLVKSFQDAQEVKQQPAVQLALKLEKKVMQMRSITMRGESDQKETQAAMSVLLRKHVEDICRLYKTSEFCGGDEGKRVKPVKRKPDFLAGALLPPDKKMKSTWISLDQFKK